jgi:hypothetical protein
MIENNERGLLLDTLYKVRMPDRAFKRLFRKMLADGRIPPQVAGHTIGQRHRVLSYTLADFGLYLRHQYPNIVAIDGYYANDEDGFEAEAVIYLWFDDDEEGCLWQLTYA